MCLSLMCPRNVTNQSLWTRAEDAQCFGNEQAVPVNVVSIIDDWGVLGVSLGEVAVFVTGRTAWRYLLSAVYSQLCDTVGP